MRAPTLARVPSIGGGNEEQGWEKHYSEEQAGKKDNPKE
jgi:hypothetical protein